MRIVYTEDYQMIKRLLARLELLAPDESGEICPDDKRLIAAAKRLARKLERS